MAIESESQCCTLGGILSKSRTSSPKAVDDDSLLVRELNELSFQEREYVIEEIHGVADVPEETADFLAAKYEQLEDELKKISRSKRKALDRAFFLKPSIEHDREFQLMFLRADRFDPKRAALRMAKYFQSKIELFGEEKLVQKITLDDFQSEDDQGALKSGYFHVLPSKDRAGRSLWFLAMVNNAKISNWKSNARYFWYQVSCMLEDEGSQIHGIVDVTYFLGMNEIPPNAVDFIRKGAHLVMALPFRICGIHYCMPDSSMKPVVSIIQHFLGKQNRVRFRPHFGSPIEVRYSLMSFGIPACCLPITSEGNLAYDAYEKHFQDRRSIEEERKRAKQIEEETTGIVDFPGDKDVLLGRGRPFQEYCGNAALLGVVNSRREQYHQVEERFGKLCIVMDIVKNIQERGGRFLQRTPDGWKEVEEAVAVDKVRATLRSRKNVKGGKEQPAKGFTPLGRPFQDIHRSEDLASMMSGPVKRVRYV